MGIFSRMADIINSNINSLLDKAEDPQKLIRLIIQEMEETLVEVRSSSARVIADKKTANRHMERIQSEAADWATKAELAINKGREDLAKAALVEKREALQQAEVVEQELQALNDHLNTLTEEISQLQNKLNDAKAKQKAMLMKTKTVENRMKVKMQVQKDSLNKAFDKFELFERKLDSMESELEAMDLGKTDLASEIDSLAEDDVLNDELEQLKKKMAEKNSKN